MHSLVLTGHNMCSVVSVRKTAARAASEITVHVLRVTIDLIQLFPNNTAKNISKDGATHEQIVGNRSVTASVNGTT